jgi:hypothetical protein
MEEVGDFIDCFFAGRLASLFSKPGGLTFCANLLNDPLPIADLGVSHGESGVVTWCLKPPFVISGCERDRSCSDLTGRPGNAFLGDRLR